MKPVVHKDKEDKEKLEIRAHCRAAEGEKHVERVELKTHDMDTLKFIDKKLVDKGVQRLERQPADGLPLKHDPKKLRHGGKYSWEGPYREFESELEPAPAAIDEKDPNYVGEENNEVSDHVIGEVEAPAVSKAGVARIEVDSALESQLRID